MSMKTFWGRIFLETPGFFDGLVENVKSLKDDYESPYDFSGEDIASYSTDAMGRVKEVLENHGREVEISSNRFFEEPEPLEGLGYDAEERIEELYDESIIEVQLSSETGEVEAKFSCMGYFVKKTAESDEQVPAHIDLEIEYGGSNPGEYDEIVSEMEGYMEEFLEESKNVAWTDFVNYTRPEE